MEVNLFQQFLGIALSVFFSILVLSVIPAIVLSCFRVSQPNSTIGHWHKGLDGVSYSTVKFYARLRELLESKSLPGVLPMHSVLHREGGLISPRRRYFRVKRKSILIDVCAAPFGKDYFVSWWMVERVSALRYVLSRMPGLGEYFDRTFWPLTYYRRDTMIAFQDAVHNTILEAVDELLVELKLPRLEQQERRPVMKDLFAR